MDNTTLLIQSAQQAYMRADFIQSLQIAEEAKSNAKGRDWLQVQQVMMSCYQQLAKPAEVQRICTEILPLISTFPDEFHSKAYYLLCAGAAYAGDQDALYRYSEQSFCLALKHEHVEDLQYALFANIKKASALGDLRSLQSDTEKLELLLEMHPKAEIQASLLLFKLTLSLKQGDSEAAKSLCWSAYEFTKRMGFFVYIPMILCQLANLHMEKRQLNEANAFLTLAEKGISETGHPYLFEYVQSVRQRYESMAPKCEHDLIVDTKNKSICERSLGKIDFKNQHLLLDLALLLILNPYHVYSKEQLIQRIWQQSYDPSVHDNLVYVTVRRLRSMIEPDAHNPRYILRNRNGYFFNPYTKLLIKEGHLA